MPFRLSSPAADNRQRVAQAHVELLLERFAGLPEHERIAFELLALTELPIRLQSLAELLRLTGLDPFWTENGAPQLARLLLRVRELVIDPRAADLRAQGGEVLQAAALTSLVRSGRARRIAEALAGEHATALERIEPEYRSGTRMRLRMAGLLGGASPDQLVFGTYISAHNDPISDALVRALQLIGPHQLELLADMHGGLRASALQFMLRRQLIEALPASADLLAAAEAAIRRGSARDRGLLLPVWLDLKALHGEFADDLPEDEACAGDLAAYQLMGQLVAGRAAVDSLDDYEIALKALRTTQGNRAVLSGLPGKLFLACLTLGSSPAQIKRREQLVKLKEPLSLIDGGGGLQFWQEFTAARMAGQGYSGPELLDEVRLDDLWWLGVLMRWSGSSPPEALEQLLRRAHERVRNAGWQWLAQQFAALLEPASEAASLAQPPLLQWLAPQARWQSALSALAEALAVDNAAKSAGPTAHSQLRIAVKAQNKPQSALLLEITEQRPKGNGWSSGRVLSTAATVRAALDRLPPDDDPDRRVLNALLSDLTQASRFGFPAGSRTVSALVSHPRLVDYHNNELPLQAVAGEIELRTTRLADGRVQLALEPIEAADGEPFVWRRGDVLHVYRPDSSVRRIGEIIGDGIALPVEAVDQLLRLLPDLSRKLKLSSDLADLGVREVPAEPQLHALLEPFRDGLSLRIAVRPLGEAAALFPPGRGAQVVLGHRDGLALRALRDLGAERDALHTLIEHCPLLEGHDGEQSLLVEDPETALDLLAQLQSEEPALALEWRQGKPMRVARSRGDGALQLQVASKRDWFAAEGGLALDDGSVVALSELLRSLPSAQGRYLRLDDDRVIALSHELRRRLQLLRSFADERGKVQVAGVAAFALEAALDDLSDRDEAFREQLQRMSAAQDLHPALPAGFQAELRDYQIDGYRFLMRLASWNAGACLADDMGLGKTVQALAMLSARMGQGPALVVAPTSVIGNWQNEALRFAPNLSIRRYGEGDREQSLRELGAGDVLLVSYGLLTANIDSLASIEFATLVLDEAQAIKNASTQRAQAVRQLNARFRMAATGTPLENHLGELWSLFRVLNPGLLGSEDQFRRRYLNPIERDPRDPQRDVLRRLLAPFLLRRTKAEVLAELPPRTEIVLSVEPSRGESQLLAALRRQAKEKLGSAQLPVEQRRVHVLAELTRLRRAACHPSLVAPELGLASSKLEQLVELVRELSDNRHRALVFSQFVDYLTLVRERFDSEGISYQYLDGSTPSKAREQAVDAFQGGSGSVFLLSLKAGGVGLNLTAADYVIHLDPWWNPAVEQQASDRAHRIGQTRPVTVYKLVLQGSIEEQILALHGSKRELIDQVIGDQAASAPISVDELLDLLDG